MYQTINFVTEKMNYEQIDKIDEKYVKIDLKADAYNYAHRLGDTPWEFIPTHVVTETWLVVGAPNKRVARHFLRRWALENKPNIGYCELLKRDTYRA